MAQPPTLLPERCPDSPTDLPWYEQWFDQDAYELVYRYRDEGEAERLIDLLERAVRPARGAHILDVACGRGRHARSLARRGYHLTGIDLSARAIHQARKRARAELRDIRFEVGDMRVPFCHACFDGVVNLFTAFGYFEAEGDHLRTVRAMAAALWPGGWLFQDFLNAPYVARILVPEDVRWEGDIEIVQRRWIAEGRINKKIILRRGADEHTFCESVRLLTLEDFQELYAAAGLTLVRTFGSYDGEPYTPDSPRLILYARRFP